MAWLASLRLQSIGLRCREDKDNSQTKKTISKFRFCRNALFEPIRKLCDFETYANTKQSVALCKITKSWMTPMIATVENQLLLKGNLCFMSATLA